MKELSNMIGYWEEILNSNWLLGPIWAVGRSQRFWSFPDIAKTAKIDTRGGCFKVVSENLSDVHFSVLSIWHRLTNFGCDDKLTNWIFFATFFAMFLKKVFKGSIVW